MSWANHTAMHQAFDAVPALTSHGLGTYEAMALIAIAGHFDKDEMVCFPSYETIARECACSRDRAITSVKNLIRFLQVDGLHRGQTNRYKLSSWEGGVANSHSASGQWLLEEDQEKDQEEDQRSSTGALCSGFFTFGFCSGTGRDRDTCSDLHACPGATIP